MLADVLAAALATCLVARVLRSGPEGLPWLLLQSLCIRTAHGIRGWIRRRVAGMVSRSRGSRHRGRVRALVGGRIKCQVRGNLAAEYAALMQARAADGTSSGGVQGHVQFAGMQQMGMSQAVDGRSFGAGVRCYRR